MAASPHQPTEDLRFFCRDGGELIECDWPVDTRKGRLSCPKVYHEACLGFNVPEGVTWRCPRHGCKACGLSATYSCRFCILSYCEDHLPRDIKKIDRASRELVGSTYILLKERADLNFSRR
uniref:NSD Cys-His rich domain-containing protein n=1 Tax=Globisporangium ultimum (strain ATCC 200006 / CBS 805.95 / DAOM BR144) TaxID=431595 RepID=K3WN25_GLOUD